MGGDGEHDSVQMMMRNFHVTLEIRHLLRTVHSLQCAPFYCTVSCHTLVCDQTSRAQDVPHSAFTGERRLTLSPHFSPGHRSQSVRPSLSSHSRTTAEPRAMGTSPRTSATTPAVPRLARRDQFEPRVFSAIRHPIKNRKESKLRFCSTSPTIDKTTRCKRKETRRPIQ